MSILLDSCTRVLVHGGSSSVGRYQIERMRAYGTRVVGIVSRSGAGADGVPTYPTIEAAQDGCPADLLVSYANGRYLRPTVVDAFAAGVPVVVVVAEEVRFRDIVAARGAAREAGGILVGPNTNGILTPGAAVVGMFSPELGQPGRVGVISRSGTLGYGALLEMLRAGIGQSTIVGIGGALARGLSAADALRLFDADPATDVVVVLGETGSNEEEQVAELVATGATDKPVVALVVGAVGRSDQLMGHAGAVAYASSAGHEDKVAALADAGVAVAPHLGALVQTIQSLMPATAGAEGAVGK